MFEESFKVGLQDGVNGSHREAVDSDKYEQEAYEFGFSKGRKVRDHGVSYEEVLPFALHQFQQDF